DLYLDALAFLPHWQETIGALDAIARRGGGNLPVPRIETKLGGNAANLALGLAELGVQVDLIAETDPLGHHLLSRAAEGTSLRTDRVRLGDKCSVTLGLECPDANVMLSHAGPLAAFGPERLEAEDLRRIREADAVAVVNWAQNPHGTDLLATLADAVGDETFLYLDTGDPRHRPDDAMRLVENEAVWDRVDAWGLNENELGAFTRDAPGDPVFLAQALARRLGTRLDLHTRGWAATVTADSIVRVDASDEPARRTTGAGDAWNAGNIAAGLLGWPDRERLAFAHRTATAHVTGANTAGTAEATVLTGGGPS
ncbi:MAG: carbohydrate kinase family protein, partial [Euryarchaeota archaeon]|nr:carbohydrate kinase family protein [Euryarchaeota archaeon]